MVVTFLVAFSHPTHIIVSYLLLIHGPLISPGSGAEQGLVVLGEHHRRDRGARRDAGEDAAEDVVAHARAA